MHDELAALITLPFRSLEELEASSGECMYARYSAAKKEFCAALCHQANRNFENLKRDIDEYGSRQHPGMLPGDVRISEPDESLIQRLTKAFRSAYKVQNDLTIYRGVRPLGGELDFCLMLKPKGFTSTSTCPKIALHFAEGANNGSPNWGSHSFLQVISIPKGTQVLAIGREKEFLLGPEIEFNKECCLPVDSNHLEGTITTGHIVYLNLLSH